MAKKINLIALLIIVFFVAIAVWYSPILFKGYSVVNIWEDALVARNLAKFNVFGAENSQNVILASSLAEEQAQPYSLGNKLTPLIIAQIFKVTGIPSYDNLIFISLFLLSLTLLIFTFTVYYLFDLKTAAIFAFVYILLPFNWWQGGYNFAKYDVALLLLSLFFLFFILGFKKNKCFLIILSGIFLAFTGIAKEALLVIAPVLFFYFLFKKQKKYLLYLFIPFFIVLSIFWLPDMVSGKNYYLGYFFKNQEIKQESFLNWDHICHLFPDPYTYHFNSQEYIQEYQISFESSDMDLISRLAMSKVFVNMGLKSPSLIERFKVGTVSLIRHLSRFLAIEDIGGPFIFLLFILGFVYLKEKNNYLYLFFLFWIIFLLFFISYIFIGARSHLIDFGWVIALAITLGLLSLINIFSQHFNINKTLLTLLITFLVLYNLLISSHVLWGRVYDEPHHLKLLTYAQQINKLDINDRDVIAVNLGQFKVDKLNYLTDKSMVIFHPDTVEKLLKQDKLQQAFDKFGVKYVLGYPDELTEEILKESNALNIVSDSFPIKQPELSKTKSWLMNLIR